MPTAEISNIVLSRPERRAFELLKDEETWEHRILGIHNSELPPLSDEEIIAESDRLYEELQSGKARG